MKRIFLPLLFVYFSMFLSGQTTFEKHPENPLIIPDQELETRLIAPNSIIYDNNQYQMWYSGGEFPARGGDLFIAYATSSDGYSWAKDSANPVFENDTIGAWDDKGVYKASVLKIGATYHMWYNGYSDTLNSAPRNIGHATSSDGINWMRDPANPVISAGSNGEWDYSSLANPTVVFDGTKYHMWYSGNSGNESVIQLGHATSDDGSDWIKDPNNPVIIPENGTWDNPQLDYPFALFDGTTFHIWYTAGSFLSWQLGYATSSDGRIWTKSPNPILSSGETGSWDSRYLSMPAVLYNNATQKYRMWYRGESLANTNGGIGYAESVIKYKRSEYTIEDWRKEIDEYWGEGDPTEKKLEIFDEIWNKVDSGFNTFQNLDIDWDAIREKYRPEIEAGVSQGRFVGIINSMGRQLMETHLWLYNKPINLAPNLEPGEPIMNISSFANNKHFGATLTPLPDSSLLVYKAMPNHPLGLVPGDIVLGYEGVLWKKLYKDLLAAELPLKLNGITGSSKEATGHIYLSSAGLNWHLFDTLDIVKYDSGDTLHLSTTNLAGQKGRIMGSDQVTVKGIDFWADEGPEVQSMDTTSEFYWTKPDINADYLTYGILDNTDIGYIYLATASNENVSNLPSKLLEAFLSLENDGISGLIFDLRYNSGGSWDVMDDLLAYIYNEGFTVTNLFQRSSETDYFLMEPYIMTYGKDAGTNEITVRANANTSYNKPIAILTGPGCVSGGEYTVLKFNKYSSLKTFGKATGGTVTVGSLSIGPLTNSNEWVFGEPLGNAKLYEDSTKFLSHTGLKPDEEIWLEPDAVARGEDNVVTRAVEWIEDKVYPHNAYKNDLFYYPETNVPASVHVKNSNNHNVEIWSYLYDEIEGVTVDSVILTHQNSDLYSGIFNIPTKESNYSISYKSKDLDDEANNELLNVSSFTSKGPIKVDHFEITSSNTEFNTGDLRNFSFYLKNNSSEWDFQNIRIKLSQIDSCLIPNETRYSSYATLHAGDILSGSTLPIRVANNCEENKVAPVEVNIYDGANLHWKDTVNITINGTSTFSEEVAQNEEVFFQISPNPVSDVLYIKSRNVEYPVEFQLFDIYGRMIVNKKINNGDIVMDIRNLSIGVYIYKINCDGEIKNGKIVKE